MKSAFTEMYHVATWMPTLAFNLNAICNSMFVGATIYTNIRYISVA